MQFGSSCEGQEPRSSGRNEQRVTIAPVLYNAPLVRYERREDAAMFGSAGILCDPCGVSVALTDQSNACPAQQSTFFTLWRTSSLTRVRAGARYLRGSNSFGFSERTFRIPAV